MLDYLKAAYKNYVQGLVAQVRWCWNGGAQNTPTVADATATCLPRCRPSVVVVSVKQKLLARHLPALQQVGRQDLHGYTIIVTGPTRCVCVCVRRRAGNGCWRGKTESCVPCIVVYLAHISTLPRLS